MYQTSVHGFLDCKLGSYCVPVMHKNPQSAQWYSLHAEGFSWLHCIQPQGSMKEQDTSSVNTSTLYNSLTGPCKPWQIMSKKTS